jgi:hypothetical protein
VSLELTLFLEFQNFFVKNLKICLIVSFEEKKFVFFRRSMGRAGMCWSQPARVDYISPKRWAVGIRKLERSPLRVSSPIF